MKPKYTYLRHVEAQINLTDEYVTLSTLSDTGSVTFRIDDGTILVNMNELKAFCEREDISLSESERVELLGYIEDTISQAIEHQ